MYIFICTQAEKDMCPLRFLLSLTLRFHCCIFVVFCTSKLQLLRPLSTEDDFLESLCAHDICVSIMKGKHYATDFWAVRE